MKTKFFRFLLLLLTQHAIGQKKPLDYDAIDSWPNIENAKISNDGRYICYNISSKKDGTKLFLQSTDNSWKMEINYGTNAFITEDSRRAIFKTNGDSIAIAELGNGKINYLKNAGSFKVPQEGDGQWFAYQEKNPSKTLILFNLYSGNQVEKYENVNEFEFSGNGRKLVVQQIFKNNSEELDSIHFLDLGKSISHFVWAGGKTFSFILDTSGSQIAFINETNVNGEKTDRICYYKTGMDSAIDLVNRSATGMQGASVDGNLNFSQDGENLFFSILDSSKQEKEDSLKMLPHNILLWSYRDWELGDRSESINREHAAVINLQTKNQVVRIEKDEGDRSEASLSWCYSQNNVLQTTNNRGDHIEHDWRSSVRPNLYLVSTVDGKRILLSQDCLLSYGNFGFSPKGNYVFWFDRIKGHWFTYNIKSGIVKNISAQVPVSTAGNDLEKADYSSPEGFAGWLKSDAGLLVYDKYDIWKLDPSGLRAAKNITDGYGRKHKTIFRNLDQSNFTEGHPTFESGDSLLLYSINSISKANGFAKIFLNQVKPPKILTEGPMDYYGLHAGAFETESSDGFVLKAKCANTYIFRPNRDSLYSNLSLTNDLIHFQNLTNLEPQKQFNWYRSELVHWKQSDGIVNDGILYKPEDFDPGKKYPLIVYVYEQFSESVNRFFTPELSSGDIIIPWYTSHGYLMFVPDIHYVLGHPGRSAYNSVISGIEHLSDSPWVDTKRLGLQGHSFGGYETNYIVTRTNIFAAASSADGVSDWIAFFGQRFGNTTATQSFIEKNQGRMGSTLWQRPDQYISESPIFEVDQIKTPLFILHNTQDDLVNVSQSVALFTSLRRLGKKAWMLQYTDVGHNIRDEKAQLDYSIRLNQFFDHYLKGAPPTKWMTEGGTSLELDTSGRKP